MQITAAAVVTARPWVRGSELAPQRAIVLASQWLDTDEYAIVWFPKLGDPKAGPTVMAIRQDKITEARPFDGEAPSWILASYRACKRANGAGDWHTAWRPAGFEIERIAKATARFQRDRLRNW